MENRYLHLEYDQQMRQLWQTHQIYRQKNLNFKTYTIDTPPPTVSGSLHIGHIFSYTQTDIIARYKRMTGHNVFYPFGFDCNGLATERFVEKKHNTNVSKLGREKFIDLCLSTTEEMKVKFVHLWRTMGLSAELEKTYSTIAPDVAKIAQESFIDLVKKDYAYIKSEPALYCTQCRTTVAQAELDDMEQSTIFHDIAFKTTDDEKIIIATTRPELLPSCVAILFHPDDARFTYLKNKQAIVPLFGQSVPILPDETVVMEKGSGLVMVCTFGDKTDIEWYKKHKLPHVPSIGFDGKFMPSAGLLVGLNVADARKKVIELLQEQNLILNQKQIQNSVNVHERCKHPIEYAILPQWFIKVVQYSKEFLKVAEKINWYPLHMKARFDDWVKNLSWDWCISRQRVFGIPFPVWYCNDCSAILLADVSELPIDPQQVAYNKPCNQCKSINIRPEKDVMDTWNTSSLTPYICKALYKEDGQSPFLSMSSPALSENQNFIPMSMRPQAHDIIRTWAFYTIVKSWMHDKTLPWHDIVISGYVLSENKEKISKSKDNAPTEPEKLLTQYAPDAIRFWTASGTLGQDVAFSPEQIGIGQKLLTKLWNALKFVHINNQAHQIPAEQPKNIGLVNIWMLDRLNVSLQEYHAHFEKNEFSLALQTVEKLFWHDFCDNYLEIIKDQFFNPTNYIAEDVNATMWTLNHTAFTILQLYSPYLPHITEYLYQQIFVARYKTSSIHLTQFASGKKSDEVVEKQMNVLLDVISQVRKLKTGAQLSLKTEIKTLTICGATKAQTDLILQNQAIIKGVCKAQNIVTNMQRCESSIISENEVWNILLQLL
ncbi:valine--tRNA ligase [Candidatus Babeliales bacterium]|nr:valine--tRNA ligase [Candidatus Babeliales bacterium]